jgi:hypothetical protein
MIAMGTQESLVGMIVMQGVKVGVLHPNAVG